MSSFFLLAQAGYAMQVGSGKIQGGWEYVYASYGLTYVGLLLYGLSLWRRRAAESSASKETP